jgi:ribosomal protein S18 acetylase RimI-like enzyme
VINDNLFDLYLAYYNNIPVSTILISFVNNIAGIYWLGVLPQYRNKAIASYLTSFSINEIAKKNFKTVISQNLTSSKSLFKKIGFNACGNLPLYMYENKNL